MPKKPTPSTEAPLTIEELDALMPPLPEDHPIFDAGWIIGQTFPAASPSDAREILRASENSPSSPSQKSEQKQEPRRQLSEEEIQAELKKLREQGYGTVELSFAEEALRGLEGKPEGNA